VASFSEVTGLTADGDPVDYREGKDPINNVRKLIGLRKFSVITLIERASNRERKAQPEAGQR
jgi:hypothetical protein